MKRLFIYKGLELEANINGYATYELLCCAQHNNSTATKELSSRLKKSKSMNISSQLNMYLNYFKAEVMQPDDNPPIGILLCTEKGDTLVKYATAGLDPNIFVQKYRIELPTEEEIKEFISSSNYESYKL